MTERPPAGFCRMHTRDGAYCWRPAAVCKRLGCQHEHLIEADLCPRCLGFVADGLMQCGECATAKPELIQPWMTLMPRARWIIGDDGLKRRPVAHEGCVFSVIPEPAEPAELVDNMQISA